MSFSTEVEALISDLQARVHALEAAELDANNLGWEATFGEWVPLTEPVQTVTLPSPLGKVPVGGGYELRRVSDHSRDVGDVTCLANGPWSSVGEDAPPDGWMVTLAVPPTWDSIEVRLDVLSMRG